MGLDPDAAEVDLEVGEERGAHPDGPLVPGDQSVLLAFADLVEVDEKSARIHDPVVANPEVRVELRLLAAVPGDGPTRQDLDDEVGRPLDRPLGDDRFATPSDVDEVRLHDGGRCEDDVDGGVVDASEAAFLNVRVQ